MPHADAVQKTAGLSGSVLQALGLGAVRKSHHLGKQTFIGPAGDAAVLRVQQGRKVACAHTDVSRRATAKPIRSGRQAGPWPRTCAICQPWRQAHALTDNLNFWKSRAAGDMGQLRSAASRDARGLQDASNSGRVRAMCRSTTKTNGARRFCRPRPSAAFGLLDDPKSASIGSKAADGPHRLLAGRDQGLARPVAVPARHLRPRGRGAAPGRPWIAGAPRRRLCAA